VDISFLIGLLLAIPLSILANMWTPNVQRWWATTNEKRRVKRVEKVRGKIGKLQVELKNLQGTEDVEPGSSKEEGKLFSKEPRLEAAMGGSHVAVWADKKAHVVQISNAEFRYPTTALNLAASASYRPFHGEPRHINYASWFSQTNDLTPKQSFSSKVSLGMLERASVVVVLGTSDRKFYTVASNWLKDGKELDLKDPLEYGEWMLNITLNGDNVRADFSYKILLSPDGTIAWTRLSG
jgi:hypothetical protein